MASSGGRMCCAADGSAAVAGSGSGAERVAAARDWLVSEARSSSTSARKFA